MTCEDVSWTLLAAYSCARFVTSFTHRKRLLKQAVTPFFMLHSRAFLSLALRRFSSRLPLIMKTSSHSLPADTLFEEEGNPDYDPRRFYPARVGETIKKYQIISKLGWGTGSTVWLAKDINRFMQCPFYPARSKKPLVGHGNRTDTWRSKLPTASKEIGKRPMMS